MPTGDLDFVEDGEQEESDGELEDLAGEDVELVGDSALEDVE
ncbi:MAG: hypothetical protein ACKO96_27465 [Flammeovirgaceae bacterium]